MGSYMQPQKIQDTLNVRAMCPDCEAVSAFVVRCVGGEPVGLRKLIHSGDAADVSHAYYLARCSGCNRGALAVYRVLENKLAGGEFDQHILLEFYPNVGDRAPLPEDVPDDLAKEYREAETCASQRAYRAACAMLRSTLEKTLRKNGYKHKDQGKDRGVHLPIRLEWALQDDLITRADFERVKADVKNLADDILHGEDRTEVSADEYDKAHLYVQRILEDFYTDRPRVKAVFDVVSKDRGGNREYPPPRN